MLSEVLHREIPIILTEIGVYACALMAFSASVRREVYRRQKGKCGMCGKHFPKLQTHHIVPHFLKGSDTEDNAIGLCQRDHKFADMMALKHHIFFPDTLLYLDLQEGDEKDGKTPKS